MVAEDILRFALYKEVLRRDKTAKKRRLNDGGARRRGSDDSDASGSESDEEEDVPLRMEHPAKAAASQDADASQTQAGTEGAKGDRWGESQDVDMDGATQVAAAPAGTGLNDDGTIRPER